MTLADSPGDALCLTGGALKATIEAVASTRTAAGTEVFVVRCADGAVRHRWPFDSRRAADRFAWWGHCCTATHDVETFHVEPAVVTAAEDGQLVGLA